MIRASDPPFLDAAVTERSAPVCAPIIEQTDTSFFIAEQDKRLAENPDQLRRSLLCELAGDAHRIPIPT
jgi:hypothetical protein